MRADRPSEGIITHLFGIVNRLAKKICWRSSPHHCQRQRCARFRLDGRHRIQAAGDNGAAPVRRDPAPGEPPPEAVGARRPANRPSASPGPGGAGDGRGLGRS